jgi:hypothetical protein
MIAADIRLETDSVAKASLKWSPKEMRESNIVEDKFTVVYNTTKH